MFKIFHVILIGLCLSMANCGSNKYCLNPEILTNKLKMKKEQVVSLVDKIDEQRSWKSSSGMFEAKSFFKKIKKSVFIKYDSSGKRITCYDEKNNLLWSYPLYPLGDNRYKMSMSISIYDSDYESIVILLVLERKTNNYLFTQSDDSVFIQSAVIINEEGIAIKQFNLSGLGDVYKYILNSITVQTIFGKPYLVADGGDGIGIFDFNNGNLITYLYSRQAAPRHPEGFELEKHGNKFVVFYTNLRSYTHSSKIYILSDKWELLYEEVLQRGWLFGKVSGRDDGFIIKTFDIKECKNTGKNIIWKYTIE